MARLEIVGYLFIVCLLGGCCGVRNGIPFNHRSAFSSEQAFADIQGDFEGQPRMPLLWAKKKGFGGGDDSPTLLVTVHAFRDKEGPQVMRFYHIQAGRYWPQLELSGDGGAFQELRFARVKNHDFLVAWFHYCGSGGGGPQWVLWHNPDGRVVNIPYSDPQDRIRPLARDEEYLGDAWYLDFTVGDEPRFSRYLHDRRHPTSATAIRGKFDLVEDPEGKPARLDVLEAHRDE
ncbi:MAG: hypothetical protein WBD63_03410 [Phycisphaerae bacterium]|nr:hypothetical protein [Phycisphaerae bacterium]